MNALMLGTVKNPSDSEYKAGPDRPWVQVPSTPGEEGLPSVLRATTP